jgi:hypothetical protein
MYKTVIFVCLATMVPACSPIEEAPPPENVEPDELFPGWTHSEIAEAAPPYGADGPVYVLAWKVADFNDRRVEICLALRVLDKDDGLGRWSFSRLGRFPLEDPRWRVTEMHVQEPDVNYPLAGRWESHNIRLKALPQDHELDEVLEKMNWTFDLTKEAQRIGFQVIASQVCENQWQQAFGHKPTRAFE